MLKITIRSEWDNLSSVCVCVSLLVCQVGYLFVGVSGSAEDALLSFLAPPGTSESSLLDKPRHNWSPETVDTNIQTDEVKLNTHREYKLTINYCGGK